MSEFANMIVWRLAYTTCLVTVAGAFVWMATRNHKVISPRLLECCHWFVLAIGLFIVPVSVSLPIPVTRVKLVQQSRIGDFFPATIENAGRSAESFHREPTQDRRLATALVSAIPSRSFPKRPSIASCLLAVWLVGMIFVVARLIKSYYHLVRSVDLRQCADPSWVEQWSELQSNAGVVKQIPLYESDGFGPALCWWPDGYRLIIPSDLWRQLTDVQRNGILLHELAHYRRYDVARLLVSNLLAGIHWFNPIVWRSVRQIAVVAEWAADDAVKKEQGSIATTFARTLLEIGRSNPHEFSISASVAGGSLSTRIRRLTSPSISRESVVRKLCLVVPIVVIVALGAFRIELRAQDAESSQVRVSSQFESAKQGKETEGAPPKRKNTTQVAQWVHAVEFAHKVISSRKVKTSDRSPEPGSEVFSDVRPDRIPFLNDQLYQLLASPGFIASHRVAADERSWLFRKEHAKYRFILNYDLLLPEVKGFVNALAEDIIFEDILDSIQHDPRGPQIDVRGDLLKRLGEEVIVIVDAAGNSPSSKSLLFAFATNDEKAMGAIVERVSLSDPLVVKVEENDVTIYVYSDRATAMCVAGNRLLYGDVRLVRAAVSRLKKLEAADR